MNNINNMSKDEIKARFYQWRAGKSQALREIMYDKYATMEHKEKARSFLEKLYPVQDDMNPLKFSGFREHLENSED